MLKKFKRRLSWSAFSDFARVFALEMCVAARNREKFTKTPFWTSRSFKVIHVSNLGKLVSSACYDEQQVYLCLSAAVLTLDELITVT